MSSLSPELLMWLTSVTSAALIFATGLLIGRGRRSRTTEEIPQAAPDLTEQELATAQLRIKEIEKAFVDEQGKSQNLAHDLLQSQQMCTQLEGQLKTVQTRSPRDSSGQLQALNKALTNEQALRQSAEQGAGHLEQRLQNTKAEAEKTRSLLTKKETHLAQALRERDAAVASASELRSELQRSEAVVAQLKDRSPKPKEERSKDALLLKQALSNREEEIKSLRSKNDELRQRIKEAPESIKELEKARKEADSLKVKLRVAETKTDELKRLNSEFQHLKNVRGQTEKLERDLEAALQRNQELANQLKQGSVTDLPVYHNKWTDPSSPEEMKAVREELHEVGTLREEIDKLRYDNSQLRDALNQTEPLAQALTAAKEEIRELRLKSDTRKAPASELKAKKIEEPTLGRPAKTIGLPAISGLLDEFTGSKQVRTAVVSDGFGLLVAGSGETTCQEELSAVSSIAGKLANFAFDMLPLGDVELIHLRDSHNNGLYCHLFRTSSDPYSLTTLSSEQPIPEDEMIQWVITSLRSALES